MRGCEFDYDDQETGNVKQLTGKDRRMTDNRI